MFIIKTLNNLSFIIKTIYNKDIKQFIISMFIIKTLNIYHFDVYNKDIKQFIISMFIIKTLNNLSFRCL